MKLLPVFKTLAYVKVGVVSLSTFIAVGTFRVIRGPRLKLEKMEQKAISKQPPAKFKVDTLEAYPKQGVAFVYITHKMPRDSFYVNYGVTLKIDKKHTAIYEFADPGDDEMYITAGDYILDIDNKSKQVLRTYNKNDILKTVSDAYKSEKLSSELSFWQIIRL